MTDCRFPSPIKEAEICFALYFLALGIVLITVKLLAYTQMPF